jgi:hypothetical protein
VHLDEIHALHLKFIDGFTRVSSRGDDANFVFPFGEAHPYMLDERTSAEFGIRCEDARNRRAAGTLGSPILDLMKVTTHIAHTGDAIGNEKRECL